MKCIKCRTEWETAGTIGSIVVCPSCGTAQACGAVYDSLDLALKTAVQILGEDRLRSGSAMYSLFLDLAPEMQREAKLLNIFLRCNGHIILLDARDGQ